MRFDKLTFPVDTPDKVEQLGQALRDLAQSKTKQINIAYDHAMTLRQS